MIFISHKKEDAQAAKSIKSYFESKGANTYLDEDDIDLKSNANLEVTEHIVSNLRESTAILTVFSKNTPRSMWVPFEIGIAYERNLLIGTCLTENIFRKIDLPEYLHGLPILKYSNADLDSYLELYFSRPLRKSLLQESISASQSRSAADMIRELKSKITGPTFY